MRRKPTEGSHRGPQFTKKVRSGLIMAITLSDSWREVDGDETITKEEVAELDAALRWLQAQPEPRR